MTLARRTVSEFVGTAILLAAIVGSGIMAQHLAAGNVALALLANAIATGGALLAIIAAFGPISGGHFNPAVSLSDAAAGGITWRDAAWYCVGQVGGGVLGAILANAMFGLPLISIAHHQRGGGLQWLSEFVATFGLLCVIWGSSRFRAALVPFAVAGYIVAAYWFTPSTSFANPAVTIGRVLSDTFTGIQPTDALPFILAQLLGAACATALFAALAPRLREHAEDVVVPHAANS